MPVNEPNPEAACTLASAAAPAAWTTFGDTAEDGDNQAVLIGRWRACSAGTLVATPHSVVEFGDNRRYQVLKADPMAAGALIQVENAYFYLLASGQLDLRDDVAGHVATTLLSFLSGDQAFRVAGGPPAAAGSDAGIYVRIPAAPDNGLSNAPSVSDGGCNLVGTWDSTRVSSGDSAIALSFDGLGNFVGHPPGADPCTPTNQYGTYQLTPGQFYITSNVGFGRCAWWFTAGFGAAFENNCTQLTLAATFDNCTGGRGYLNGTTVLRKR